VRIDKHPDQRTAVQTHVEAVLQFAFSIVTFPRRQATHGAGELRAKRACCQRQQARIERWHRTEAF
jgi:hypothetical protein